MGALPQHGRYAPPYSSSGSVSDTTGVVGMGVVGPVVVEDGPSRGRPIRAEAATTVLVHRVGWAPVAQS